MKKNGFFSMSIVYSFFLVFALITAVLLANYAHNRLLVRNFNEDIKEELNDRGNDKLAYLKNLLYNGSFEWNSSQTDSNRDWKYSTATRVSNQRYNGYYGVKFPVVSSSTISTISQDLVNIKIKKGHVYYFQRYIFTMGQDVKFNSTSIYLTNPSKSYTYYFVNDANKSYKANNWQVVGNFLKIPDNIEEVDGWQFVFTQIGTSFAPMYTDAFMLIDVTQAYNFAAGDIIGGYPYDDDFLEWLNNNIEYFNGKYVHNKTDYPNYRKNYE